MEKVKIENPRKYDAKGGETLEMHFRILSLPFISQIQQNIIKNRLNANPIYKVLKTESSNGEFIVTITIVENPFPLVLAIAAVMTVCGGFFIWASLDKVYKIIEEPGGRILSIGAVTGAIMAILALMMLLKRGG